LIDTREGHPKLFHRLFCPPLSTIQTFSRISRNTGCAKDLNRDGVIDDNEGITTVSPEYKSLGPRDMIRQHIVELMQLVRVIEADVDGDGVADFDPSQISYFGLSFGGGALGQSFMAVEPNVRVGVLASTGGMNSRFDLLWMRPAARQETGEALAARVPSLLNSPGLTNWDGIAVPAPSSTRAYRSGTCRS
jgi:hypothetical protein